MKHEEPKNSNTKFFIIKDFLMLMMENFITERRQVIRDETHGLFYMSSEIIRY